MDGATMGRESGQRLSDGEWLGRIGQIETILHFFGSVCSVSVDRADGATIYFQAQRVEDGVEVEATGNHYLPPAARLTQA